MRQGRTVYISRERKHAENECGVFILKLIVFAFLLVVPYMLITTEQTLYEMTVAFEEAEEIVVSLPSDRTPDPRNTGELIHVHSGDIKPSSTLADADFLITSPGALKMRRVPEFCQWQEFYTETTHRDSEGREHTTRTYYYVKGWHRTPIISAFFDQPFAHNNPLRNPFPDHYWQVESSTFGDYQLEPEIIDNFSTFRTVDFSHDSLLSFKTNSLARYQHNFDYIGGGYFYSPYEMSGLEFIATLAGRAFEGSLDIQLGDFFPSCTPGDIRVHYESAHPQTASVIGVQLTGSGKIGGWTSSRGFVVALMQEGIIDAETMFANALSEYRNWTVLIWRGLFILACWILVKFYLVPGLQEPNAIVVSLSLTCALLGVLWGVIWGNYFLLLFGALGVLGLSFYIFSGKFPATQPGINLRKQ